LTLGKQELTATIVDPTEVSAVVGEKVGDKNLVSLVKLTTEEAGELGKKSWTKGQEIDFTNDILEEGVKGKLSVENLANWEQLENHKVEVAKVGWKASSGRKVGDPIHVKYVGDVARRAHGNEVMDDVGMNTDQLESTRGFDYTTPMLFASGCVFMLIVAIIYMVLLCKNSCGKQEKAFPNLADDPSNVIEVQVKDSESPQMEE
jgi:hypothetical protein